ncbi:rRNA maturation RNase YbeY [Tsukamurella sp. 8F]|uniref:rRNA maturation RNase YbeY n=1 Tax=unclassified Tsukamurella TaxID=2633480 RepID=UPI0023B899B5|nr:MULTISPECIES: rRNA maturation RNase YbeY [unclassified Tsukamurella]MDF0530016.1 rRNA maturation RNase YbeY [Tsukamurella sp. 8J]MDF0587212.1 rRNA maturation RNase YbeY [Tsukamurella sp. 8F]
MSIEFANESGMDIDEAQLVAVAAFAIDAMDVHPAAELNMLAVDLDTMADLHVKWMDLPGPTDVMSFPMDELTPGGRPDAVDPGPATLGDIVLCPQFAADQAESAGHATEHELNVLTVHGVLHLLGFDHAEPDEEREMFALQDRIVADFYATRQDRARKQRMAARDEKLLGRTGFLGRRD